jgi:2-oxoisovalerate dehydrogenase E2 component (dihydrolipoyl transacylase)
MGTVVFKLPDMGEGTAEAEIIKWHIAVGDNVQEEQIVVEVMTDKATVEVASPVTGRVVSRKGEEGTKAAVGSELIVFEVEGKGIAPAVEASGLEQETELVRTHDPAKRTAFGAKAMASPAVRARAKSLHLDLSAITGSGPDHRIIHGDLDAILVERRVNDQAPPNVPIGEKEDGVEDIKLFGIRRHIAVRMQDAKRRIPHFAFVEEVDVTELELLRGELNTSNLGQAHFTVLSFLVLALIRSVGDHPVVNAHFDDQEGVIRRFKSVHAGIATQTRHGLLVPVIRHAELMNLRQLAEEVRRLSEAARSGKATRQDLTGSTITVTSLGALGGIAATPIINPPEVAIIGVNKIEDRPVVRDGTVAIRKMMNLSASFDHRIVDGFDAAAFIKTVKDLLEKPALLANS